MRNPVQIKIDESAFLPRPGFVPCAGCVLCCKGDAVRLLPGDNADQYMTEPHPYRRGERVLAHKPDGSCVYLGPSGCTIHETKPTQCKQMDCRVIASRVSLKFATNAGLKKVWLRGKNLTWTAKHGSG